jgi:peptide/nickel transport system ATP-binding protein/oligopeptide transport system ATP-binding protein
MLERPTFGRVVFDGRDLTRLRVRELRDQRRRIQIIFQDPYASLNPRLTVRSTLEEVLRVHSLVPRAEVGRRVAKLLELVGLSASAADHVPAAFSGGQRQRICIARALAAEPDLLIADEAVSSLDVSIQAQVINLLLGLSTELGLAMIFISHDLHVVRLIARRVAVMFGGRIVESLPPDRPLEDAQHPYTQALLMALPRLDSALPEGLDAGDLSSALPVSGCPFRERCPHVLDICHEVDPLLVELSDGHRVACHYVFQSSGSEHASRQVAKHIARGGEQKL